MDTRFRLRDSGPGRVHPRRRRGVVLILIMAMLSLMALIGVSFALVSGQYQRASRSFAQAFLRPNAQDLVEFGIAQLINDTSNPMSALRGHSLKNDMFGNDGVFNGFLDRHPVSRQPLLVVNSSIDADGTVVAVTNVEYVVAINAGFDFTHWTVKVLPVLANEVAQTFEVLQVTNSGGFVALRLTPWRAVVTNPTPLDNPNPGREARLATSDVAAASPLNGRTFILDGRYLNAFNGPGMSTFDNDVQNPINAQDTGGDSTLTRYENLVNGSGAVIRTLAGRHANFRLNGIAPGSIPFARFGPTLGAPGNPFAFGMDEDYDAPDLENWFLAIQSVDGKVVVPSFHRPSILVTPPVPGIPASNQPQFNDYTAYPPSDPLHMSPSALRVRSKFLRPRSVDHPNWNWREVEGQSIKDPIPDPTTGDIQYDVDNDGDGYREGVWLDLGYAPQRDPITGKLYKPLFSFTVIGLNGKLPLNMVGNISGRKLLTANFASAAGDPTWDHTSHLGYCSAEINPKFALQNAFNPAVIPPPGDPNYPNFFGSDADGNGTLVYNPAAGPNYFSQTDNTGVNVAVTQLRNLLTGTRPHVDPLQFPPDLAANGENNYVQIGASRIYPGNPVNPTSTRLYMPNNLPDAADLAPGGVVTRRVEPVEGLWGESEGIPNQLFPFPGYLSFQNRSRAGKSVTPNPIFARDEGTDDDYDAYDPYPAWQDPANGIVPERFDLYEITGAMPIPAERIRRFSRPIDPVGTGRVVPHEWNGYLRGVDLDGDGVADVNQVAEFIPQALWGPGSDRFGRVQYHLYSRPPGMPRPEPSALPNSPAVNDVNILSGFTQWMTPGGDETPPTMLMTPTPRTVYGPWNLDDPSLPASWRYPFFYMAGMPFDRLTPGVPQIDVSGTIRSHRPAIPTYLPQVTVRPYIPSAPLGNYLGIDPNLFTDTVPTHGPATGSAIVDEPDEFNPYFPSYYDSPYSWNDLDWLLNQDAVIDQFDSRLGKLAPVSFNKDVNPNYDMSLTGRQRRKLFSTSVADLNRYSFAPDNPANAYVRNTRGSGYIGNGGFRAQNPALHPSMLGHTDFLAIASGSAHRGATPPVAHGDRRINLNFALPVSADPFEPVRRKWISEVYDFMVRALPPLAVDHPAERAKLGQWIVNLVDNRDTDATSTIWTNPELVMIPATTTFPARVAFADDVRNVPPMSSHPNWANRRPLVHVGLENQAVALNEILAFTYSQQEDLSNPEAKLFIELVNTQTRSNSVTSPFANSNRLDLRFWEFVVLDDGDGDWRNRPDPITGEFDPAAYNPANATPVPMPDPNDPDYDTNLVRPLRDNGGSVADDHPRYFYTLTNTLDPNYVDSETSRFNPSNPNPPRLPTPRLDDAWVRNVLDPDNLGHREKRYKWLYLRRPANPLLPADPATNPMVTVDSFRFVVIEGSNNWGDANVMGGGTVRAPINDTGEKVHAMGRKQPYRGGHVLYDHRLATYDAMGNPNLEVPLPRDAYGTNEQTFSDFNVPNNRRFRLAWANDPGNLTGNTRRILNDIEQSLTHENQVENRQSDEWGFLPILDRDYMNVIEATLVPTSSPGLFTKQFIDNNFRPDLDTNLNDYFATPPTFNTLRARDGSRGGITLRAEPAQAGTDSRANAPAVYPTLADNFFYSAANPFDPTTDPNNVPSILAPATVIPAPNAPPPQVDGVTGKGWHRMLEFFEVPSAYHGTLGGVREGENFDWARQDVKPGLINLNLVIDEEVFFGLIDDPRLDQTPVDPALGISPLRMVHGLLPDQKVMARPYNRGYLRVFQPDPINNPALAVATTDMKVAFRDFLALRHGGSGYIFANGAGPVAATTPANPAPGDPPIGNLIAAERPFRSLAHPDIDYTVMRPAPLPPSTISTTLAGGVGLTPAFPDPGPIPTWSAVTLDPGTANPYLDYNAFNTGTQYSRIHRVEPPRRLFQIPDHYRNFGDPNSTIATFWGSTERGNPSVNLQINHAVGGVGLVNPFANLFGPQGIDPAVFGPSNNYDPAALGLVEDRYDNLFLGGIYRIGQVDGMGVDQPPASGDEVTYRGPGSFQDNENNKFPDRRRNPYFRSEILQKVTNLTTTRTQQYAVWVTVGLFEVIREGNPRLLEPDELGPELKLPSGETQRFRSFFVIDRNRATGFNPVNPADHREVIVHRRRIL